MKYESLRSAYGEKLVELGKKDKRVVALEADLGKSTQSIMFANEIPERYFQMGIAEQNMASTAAGLALTGKIPFISTFAVFASGRAYDQIRSSIAIPNLTVLICGSSAGLSDFGDGKTHQSIDDIGIMRVLPNMTVLSPADSVETKNMMEAVLAHKGPVYLRINRSDLPVLTDPAKPYRIGQMTRLREGKDIVIFASGVMVLKSLEAAENLEKGGISARVVNLSTVKPLDLKELAAQCAGVKAVVTAEEHNVFCGIGSAVAEALCASRLPIGMVGIKDSYGTSAKNYDELLEHYGLTASAIEKKAKEILEKL
ncbi:transketolase family protein [Treponema parvum]|uniref:transketolase family protein n=1 Tax=Treponema parvum TaxID=138851 RepID=UPI001AEC1232|nr:transketolase C-terminal domain-containing protein [Treponema parvum]QTQ15545.1 transketolase family protein [Treponema parvum]